MQRGDSLTSMQQKGSLSQAAGQQAAALSTHLEEAVCLVQVDIVAGDAARAKVKDEHLGGADWANMTCHELQLGRGHGLLSVQGARCNQSSGRTQADASVNEHSGTPCMSCPTGCDCFPAGKGKKQLRRQA